MLARLIGFSVRQPSLVVVLAALVVALAGARLGSTPVDVFPELNAPTVVVMTESGGLAADEVELGVTFPIETAVNGLAGARRVRSSSTTGLSIVWVEFDWGVDLYRARQLVSERLAAVRESLPAEAHAEIAPMTSITGEIMLLALSSPDGGASPLELRAYAEFDLRNRLLAVPGVAQVVAIGGELPQYKVEVRADRLAALGVSIDEVVEAARGAHSMASAGYLADSGGQEVPLRQFARVGSVDDLARTLVSIEGGAPVLLGDVAEVSLGAAPRRGTAADEALPAVVLSVQKTPGTNTLELTRAVDLVLDAADRTMPAGMRLDREPFRAARFIGRAVDNVTRVLLEASVIVAIVIVLFLLDARATLVTLVALPVSLAAALLVLSLAGLSLNVMTLGGLAVAIGELVDDAVIDVENVLRRLRGAPRGADPAETIVSASNEIRGSVVYATVLICLVFVPLLFLSGLEGRFFRPLGIAYIVSILASLAVALTLTPALCRLLLPRGVRAAHGDGAVVRILKRAYEPALRLALRRGAAVGLGSLGLAAGALAFASTFGSSFLPTFQEGTFTVFVMCPPGTSLAESDRLANAVERGFVGIDGVTSVTRRTGRAERDEHAEPVSSSEIEVTVAPDGDARAVRGAIDRVLETIPGVTTMVGQPIEHRLSHLLSGTPAAIAISVYGDDLGALRDAAREIESALRAVDGARDVNANREVLVSTLPIRYRAQDLAAAGLAPAAAARQVQRAIAGEKVGEVADGARRTDIVVRLAEEDRGSPGRIAELPLVGAGGATVRLREVADIGLERASNLIAREGARRKALVSLNVAEGHNLGDLVARVRETVDPIVARAGLAVSYGGQFEAQQSASRTILWMGALVVGAMLLVLRAATGSVATALVVMVNLPLALIGGIVAVFLAADAPPVANLLALAGLGGRYIAPVLSIASLVGFFTLFGIAVRNGLLLVNHYAHLEREEGCGLEEAVVRGSLERLAPILMTALTAALGLAPLALRGDAPGNEILAPLATVVLGGLASSTFLNLFVVPAGYRWLRRRYPLGPNDRDHASTKEISA
jgi:CzcA family heavy metal efflux pump